MKFDADGMMDSDHCIALIHEFYRCDESFKEFAHFGKLLIIQGHNRELSCKTYNAYASFIHHMYEFILGCIAREVGNTNITNKKGNEKIKLIENYILSQTQRTLNKWRDAILDGSAPSWANHISCYTETVSPDFAKDFREYRNKTIGHVSHERSSKLSMTEFYLKYHKYLYLLYQDSIYFWRRTGPDFPDLHEITEFSLMLKKEKEPSIG